MFLALATLVVMTTVVSFGLQSSGQQKTTGLRTVERTLARTLAERCADLAERNAMAVIDTGEMDFDLVLDPSSGGPTDGDEYIPGGGTTVYVPQSTASMTEPALGLHRYAMFALNDGACLVRYDDNADDRNADPSLDGATSNHGVDEGPNAPNNGAHIPWRDRDGTIDITAIGLYPVRAGTAPADAYHLAHARATVRRHIAAVLTPGTAGAAALWADQIQASGGGNKVCGLGGYIARDNSSYVTASANLACASGDVSQGGINQCSGTLFGDCSPILYGGASTLNNVGFQANPRATDIDPLLTGHIWGPAEAKNWLPNQAFATGSDDLSSAGAATLGGATDTICEFYFQRIVDGATQSLHHEQVFVWDNQQTDPLASLTPGFIPTASDITCDGSTCLSSDTQNHDCTTFSGDPVPTPCSWTPGGSTTVSCTGNQSLCWKLVANLGPDPVVAGETLGGVAESTADDGGDEVFQPVAANAVPFIAGGPDYATMCGGGGSGGGPYINGWTHCCSGPHWENKNPIGSGDWPQPVRWIFENGKTPTVTDAYSDDNRIHIKNAIGTSSARFRGTIIALGNIESDGGHHLCGVGCNCPHPTAPITGWNTVMSALGVYFMTNRDTGYSFYAGGHVLEKGSSKIMGDIMAATFRMKDNNVLVGDIVAFHNCVDELCDSSSGQDQAHLEDTGTLGGDWTGICTSATSLCDDSSVCMKSNNNMAGNIYAQGDLCLTDNNRVLGDMRAWDSLYIKDNNRLRGQARSGGRTVFGANNVFWRTTGGSGTAGSITISGIQSQESTW
jgi:hypothetical protein